MVIISKRICSFFGWFSGFSQTARAVTVWLFIFVRSEADKFPWLITHERIHLRQQLELLFIGTFILHMIEIFYAVFTLRLSWYEAYLWSSVEQEAYLNQNDGD